jgi:hypothetical protein
MITQTYRPEFDIIALDKLSIGCNVGGTPKHNFTRKYYDDWWIWKRKYATLLRLQDEYMRKPDGVKIRS